MPKPSYIELKSKYEDLKTEIISLKEVIKQLTEQNKFFEMLIHSLPGLFYIFNDDFRNLRWNKNVETVTGYSDEEIRSMPLFKLFTGNTLSHIRDAIDRAFNKGEAITEAEIMTKDGKKIPYFFSGVSTTIEKKKYLLGLGLDISKRILAENALRESEALYKILAERMTEGVMLFNNFSIIFVNNAFASMLGFTNNELIHNDVMTLVAYDLQMYFRDLYETLEKGICNERFFQSRWVKKDKTEIWVDGRGILITWKGQPTVLLTIRDITEAKRKEISMQDEAENLRRENVNLRSSIRDRYRFGDIIGKSSPMQKVYELILNAAASTANVVIYGESGTGKELVARAVHKMSSRYQKSFIPVNSSAIPDNLLESEFFGHKKGAFTNAHMDKMGYLDMVDGGTLFLDEVGELNPGIQAKLLRAIEGGGYSPIGSNIIKYSDFRIVSATNRNLIEQIKKGDMREDFFYRIHIIPITIPPLRERKDDIPLLLEYFLKKYSNDHKVQSINGQMMDTLINYDYPGNVRELQNIIQHYLAVKNFDFLNTSQKPVTEKYNLTEPENLPMDNLQNNIDIHEKNIIIKVLNQNKGNKTKTAQALGISRKTLFRKIKRLGLN